MKDAILIELAARWERDAKAPECEDGHPDAKVGNAEAHGRRQGLRECADGLRMLVGVLGDAPLQTNEMVKTVRAMQRNFGEESHGR